MRAISFGCLEFAPCQTSSGYDISPDFKDKIWPILLKNKNSIGSVFVFDVQKISFLKKLLAVYRRVPEVYVCLDIGPMESLSEKQLAHIAHLSFFGGDTDVFYTVLSSNVIKDIAGMGNYSVCQYNSFEEILLSKNKAEIVSDLVTRLEDCAVFLTWRHDAQVFYIFGSIDNLKKFRTLGDSDKAK